MGSPRRTAMVPMATAASPEMRIHRILRARVIARHCCGIALLAQAGHSKQQPLRILISRAAGRLPTPLGREASDLVRHPFNRVVIHRGVRRVSMRKKLALFAMFAALSSWSF